MQLVLVSFILRRQTSSRRSAADIACFEKTCFDYDPDRRRRKMAAQGYRSAKISLKEEVVLTVFPVVEAMLIPSVRRTLRRGNRRPRSTSDRSELSAIQVMSAHSESGSMNSGSILWNLRSAMLVTSAS